MLRRTLQKIADAPTLNLPAAIDAPAILGEIRDALIARDLIVAHLCGRAARTILVRGSDPRT